MQARTCTKAGGCALPRAYDLCGGSDLCGESRAPGPRQIRAWPRAFLRKDEQRADPGFRWPTDDARGGSVGPVICSWTCV